MALKYQKVLQVNGIKIQALPPTIQTSIELMDTLQFEHDDEDDDEDIQEIKRQIKSLDESLTKEIIDFVDAEADEDLNDDEIKVAILRNLINQGKTEITLKELRVLEYPMTGLDIRGEKVGTYSLSKGKYDSKYLIKKA